MGKRVGHGKIESPCLFTRGSSTQLHLMVAMREFEPSVVMFSYLTCNAENPNFKCSLWIPFAGQQYVGYSKHGCTNKPLHTSLWMSGRIPPSVLSKKIQRPTITKSLVTEFPHDRRGGLQLRPIETKTQWIHPEIWIFNRSFLCNLFFFSGRFPE